MTLELNLEDSHFSAPLYVSEDSKKRGINHEHSYKSWEASLIHSAITIRLPVCLYLGTLQSG